MKRFENEDGIDERAWERAMSRLPRTRTSRTTVRLPNPAERMADIVPPPAKPEPIAPYDTARSRAVTERIPREVVEAIR